MLLSLMALTIEGKCLTVFYDLDMLQTRSCKITEITKANNSWMILFPDKIYPALSFKCVVTNLGMSVY